MIYYTGDPHGSKHEISRFCNRMRLTEQDTIVVLGDVGANYYGDDRDGELKRAFRRLKPTIFCIHGNHEMRPASLPAYKQKEWCGGQVWYEEEYPNLLFARDGDIFTIEGLKHLVIGGAYSVDKYYRLMRGYRWWPDEQPSEAIKAYVFQREGFSSGSSSPKRYFSQPSINQWGISASRRSAKQGVSELRSSRT